MNADNIDNNIQTSSYGGDSEVIHESDRNVKEQIGALLKRKKLTIDVNAREITPRSAPVSPAANVSIMDLTWDEEEEAKSIKRVTGAEETQRSQDGDQNEGQTTLAIKVRRLIKVVDRETREASNWLEKNTKSHLRKAVVNLRSHLSAHDR